jgi:hypothetical protein
VTGADDLAAQLLEGQACPGCGTATSAGNPCPACGTLPAVTGPELAGELMAAPLAAAEIQAQQAIAEGHRMLDAAIEQIHAADRIRLIARLEIARDAAQSAFDDHKRKQAGLYPAAEAARKAHAKAHRAMEKARDEHAVIVREKETAQRYKHGLAAETEAALKLDAANTVLRRYEQDARDATNRLLAAEAAVEQSEATATRLEAERDRAVALVADPGRIPYGAETITAGLMRLTAGGKLAETELIIAGTIAGWVAGLTGVTERIEAQARAALLAEQDAAAKGKAMHLRNTRDGGVVATANPHNPSAPQAFHPAQYPAHPVQPATTPGWAT